MSFFMCRPARHMCTVSEATSTAATMARMPSHRAWFRARRQQDPGADAEQDGDADAPVNRGNQLPAAGFPEVGEADGNDQEGLEALTQRDDERLNHD